MEKNTIETAKKVGKFAGSYCVSEVIKVALYNTTAYSRQNFLGKLVIKVGAWIISYAVTDYCVDTAAKKMEDGFNAAVECINKTA